MRLDAVSYCCGIRAIGLLRPWKYVLELLLDAHLDLGQESVAVIHTAMTNLKYIEAAGDDTCKKAMELFNMSQVYKIPMQVKTLDILLAVACKHGTLDFVQDILSMYKKFQLTPSIVTYNTLLSR